MQSELFVLRFLGHQAHAAQHRREKPPAVAWLRNWLLAAFAAITGATVLVSSAQEPLRSDWTPALPKLTRTLSRLEPTPLRFEANQGQFSPAIKFAARTRGCTVGLTATNVVLALAEPIPGRGPTSRKSARPDQRENHPDQRDCSVINLSLAGASAQPAMVGLGPLPGTANYLIGNVPAKWQLGIRSFAQVQYQEVYPHVDLVYYGNRRQLEYDFIVRPGGDPGRIAMVIEGAASLRVDDRGALLVQLPKGRLEWHPPIAYQEINGSRQEIAARYRLERGNQIGFEIGHYDATQPLVIDPYLIYSSFLGGSGYDVAEAIALDQAGNIYLTGETLSADFPVFHSIYAMAANYDVFVTKLSSNGTALIYSTYLGGSGDDLGHSIAVDAAGNAYVTGQTDSPNFPPIRALQTTNQGAQDAFVAVLGVAGTNLLYSTYLGGPNFDSGNRIAVDNQGKVYVAGETGSGSNFPTRNPFQAAPGKLSDAFVAKLDPSASGAASLIYSSWLGGDGTDIARALAVDGLGQVWVAGETFSAMNFPITNAFQPLSGGGDDVFLARINAAGSVLLFSTFLGGSGDDVAYDLALDSANNVYLTGSTTSTDFPVFNAAQTSLAAGSDAFLAKLSPTGNRLLYSTLLGGTDDESGKGLVVLGNGTVCMVGRTASTNFPVTASADQPVCGGGPNDAFVATFNPRAAGSASLVYSTYLGGNDDDAALAVAADTNGTFFVTGQTASTNFFTSGGWQPTSGGASDAFLARFIAPVALQILVDGNRVLLTWPTGGRNFRLQSATQLGSPSLWMNVTNAPTLLNGISTVQLWVSNWPNYFRLTSP